MASPKSWQDDVKLQQNLMPSWHYGTYLLLLVPIFLFVVSLYIPPLVISDSGVGFIALGNMLRGGAFNSITTPDPGNIDKDVVTFVTWWSPGQYLVPGVFIWLGTSYGLALSLTTLIATVAGVLGWMQVARSFGVNLFVLLVFALGLVTFPYVTQRFLGYWGGELLLFATAPWCLYAMRWSVNQPPIVCFTISLLSAALLFFAKLTGLVIFATNVMAISLIAIVDRRQLSASTMAMWAASGIAALCFIVFWPARGPMAADIQFGWFEIAFSIASAAFSGIYGLSLVLAHPWMQLNYQYLIIELLGSFGLLLMVWIWFQLRPTGYRAMAVLLLAIILMYVVGMTITMTYFWGIRVSFEDRHFRYAGILFFLLFLTAVDQWRRPWAKSLVLAVVLALGLYGLRNYATFAYAQMRTNYLDPVSGTSQFLSPAILEYMRSEVTRNNVQRPVAAIPEPSAAISLPGFRFILVGWELQPLVRQPPKWAGRAEKIFVVIPEELLQNGEAEALLRSFTNYDFSDWSRLKLDGMVIFTQ